MSIAFTIVRSGQVVFERRARRAYGDMIDVWSEETLGRSAAMAWGGWTEASPQAWEQLVRELGRVYRPSGRASEGVREGARRIAREMTAAGASRDDVRRALTRAVQEHPVRVLLEQQCSAAGRSHWEALLADVLQCAADVHAMGRRRLLDD
jgi:hypothetical protein